MSMSSMPAAPLAVLLRQSAPYTLAALLAGAVVHRAFLLQPLPLVDERVYAAAFEAAKVGAPLPAGWYYPDATAGLGGALLRGGLSALALLGVLRALNLLGTALALGVLGAATRGGLGLALATAGMALWQPAVVGVRVGNVSGLLVGLILLATLARTGAGQTLLLAAGLPFKPASLGVALSRGPWTGGAVLGLTGLAYLGTTNRADFGNGAAASNAALARALGELIPGLPWQAVTGVALVAAATWARGSWGRGLVCAWLSLPLAWEHSLILVLPALALAWRRARDETDLRRAQLHQVLCLACLLAFDRAHYFGLADGPAWASGLLGLVPTAAAIYAGSRA